MPCGPGQEPGLLGLGHSLLLRSPCQGWHTAERGLNTQALGTPRSHVPLSVYPLLLFQQVVRLRGQFRHENACHHTELGTRSTRV